MSNQSPIGTIIGNNLGRGSGDTAFRDLVGDNLGGAMGTHIGNGQGIASNVQSEYNAGTMSEAQMNHTMLDAARGYGTTGNSPDTMSFNSIESPGMQSTVNTSFPSMSAPKTSNPNANVGPQLAPQPIVKPQANNTGAQSPADVGGMPNLGDATSVGGAEAVTGSMAVSGAIAVGRVVAPGMGMASDTAGGTSSTLDGKRQEFVKVEGNIMQKSEKKSKINTALNKDVNSDKKVVVLNNAKGLKGVAKSNKGCNIELDATCLDEEELQREEEEKEKTPRVERSAGANLRPFVVQKTFLKDEKKKRRRKEDDDKDKLENKLRTMTDEEFVSLVKKVADGETHDDPKLNIIKRCKMNILEKEAKKRFPNQNEE